jgi:hypothetical protein
MNSNVGSIDRAVRLIAGIVVIALGIYFQSWWGAIGLIPLATAFMRWCPAYSLFGISSCGSACSTCK